MKIEVLGNLGVMWTATLAPRSFINYKNLSLTKFKFHIYLIVSFLPLIVKNLTKLTNKNIYVII
jgi:hypothetical protein